MNTHSIPGPANGYLFLCYRETLHSHKVQPPLKPFPKPRICGLLCNQRLSLPTIRSSGQQNEAYPMTEVDSISEYMYACISSSIGLMMINSGCIVRSKLCCLLGIRFWAADSTTFPGTKKYYSGVELCGT